MYVKWTFVLIECSLRCQGLYLGFDVCGGLTNQRIAFLEGLIIASIVGRHVCIPVHAFLFIHPVMCFA
jgi:hypothetical protein